MALDLDILKQTNAESRFAAAARRVQLLMDKEVEEIQLVHTIEKARAQQESIKYGHISYGLEGPNEKAREAFLREQLARDPDYVSLEVQIGERSEALVHLRPEIEFHRRMHRLEANLLRGMSDGS